MGVDGLQCVCKLDKAAPKDGLGNGRAVLASTVLIAPTLKVILRQCFSGRMVVGEEHERAVAEVPRGEASTYVDEACVV